MSQPDRAKRKTKPVGRTERMKVPGGVLLPKAVGLLKPQRQ